MKVHQNYSSALCCMEMQILSSGSSEVKITDNFIVCTSAMTNTLITNIPVFRPVPQFEMVTLSNQLICAANDKDDLLRHLVHILKVTTVSTIT